MTKAKRIGKGRNRVTATGRLVRTGVIRHKRAVILRKVRAMQRARGIIPGVRKKQVSKYYLVKPEEYHAEVAELNGKRLIGIFRFNRLVIKMGLGKAIALHCMREAILEYVKSDPRTVFPEKEKGDEAK